MACARTSLLLPGGEAFVGDKELRAGAVVRETLAIRARMDSRAAALATFIAAAAEPGSGSGSGDGGGGGVDDGTFVVGVGGGGGAGADWSAPI